MFVDEDNEDEDMDDYEYLAKSAAVNKKRRVIWLPFID